MNKFLRELDSEPIHASQTNRSGTAQGSVSSTRSRDSRQSDADTMVGDILERIPNTPPVDSFSLQMYFDGLVSKLNKSSSFVKNDPRNKGVKTAAVMIRLNPNGSLHSFRVLNTGDQQDEIAFIKSVVERALPFPAFPPDIQRSVRSMAMMICIVPSHLGDGGFGFARATGGGRC